MRLRTRRRRSASTRTVPESHKRSATAASAGSATSPPPRACAAASSRAATDATARRARRARSEQRVLVGRFGREQLLAHDALDVLEAAAFARDAARDALRQIWVAAVQAQMRSISACASSLLAAERDGESIRLLRGEISGSMSSASATPNRGARLRERAPRRAARERESQAREVGLAAAARVAAADGVEKLAANGSASAASTSSTSTTTGAVVFVRTISQKNSTSRFSADRVRPTTRRRRRRA